MSFLGSLKTMRPPLDFSSCQDSRPKQIQSYNSFHDLENFVSTYKILLRIYKVLIMNYILRQLVLSQSRQWFCKYCGSNRITDVKVTNHLSRTKMFEPSAGMHDVKLSLGSLSKKKGQDYTFDSTLCHTCNHIHVVDQLGMSMPVEIQQSNNPISVIVPYTVQVQLKTLEYEEDEIIRLIHSQRKKLGKIHKRWSKRGGHNPCKRGNMGYKISLKLKRGTPIPCYVIVDRIQDRTVFRLCYGGGKTECP